MAENVTKRFDEFKITSQKILLENLLQDESDFAHGAQATFIGKVRNHNQGQKVLGVSYDAFAPLAEQVFLEISHAAKKQWGQDLCIKVWHRVGRLDVGDLSIAIVVSSRHRDESFKACRYVIEEIKHKAPVWKKEHYESGDSAWLQGHALCSHP